MADAYIGEIRVFAGNFAPTGWALCDGQLLSITQNTALFSILGTQYGGNGTTTFALPDLRGSVPMHQGTGAGLTPREVGEKVGTDSVTLLSFEMPVHTHTPTAINTAGTTTDPTNNYWSEAPTPTGPGHHSPPNLYSPSTDVTMSPNALSVTGGSQPHNNVQPYLALNFIICSSGIFPPRS